MHVLPGLNKAVRESKSSCNHKINNTKVCGLSIFAFMPGIIILFITIIALVILVVLRLKVVWQLLEEYLYTILFY